MIAPSALIGVSDVSPFAGATIAHADASPFSARTITHATPDVDNLYLETALKYGITNLNQAASDLSALMAILPTYQ